MGVTIRDIAVAVQVSHSTVSRALRNDPRISADTRQRVIQAAKAMGYHANAAARALASRKMRSVALIIPDVVDAFYSRIVAGVDAATHLHQYSLVLYITHSDRNREAAAVTAAAERRYDGGIIFQRRLSSKQMAGMAGSGTPMVLLSRHDPSLPLDSVRIDDVDGGFKAARHLVRAGHRRIGFIGGFPEEQETIDRRRGFESALAEHQVALEPHWCWTGDFTEAAGRKAAAAIARRPPGERPTAIVAANDRMAIGLIQACRELGLSVPGDLAVVGYDDIDACRYLSPQLTTVRQPTYEMGNEAARLLIARLEDTSRAPVELLLKTELVVRASCGAAVRNDEGGGAGRAPA
ncbi:MAG TPA: LacI family DNA-binding transcriptional regulator [Limnochordia bacterium]|nr:LacI family DNA-binding transcriptional regulator [Limnochordia bacterium]